MSADSHEIDDIQYFGKGCTVVCDNYFCTTKIIENFHKKDTSILCTMRANRVQMSMGKSLFQVLHKKPVKREFRRKIEIYQCKLNSGYDQYLQYGFYSDKQHKQPVIFGTNDPRLFNSENLNTQHVSKYLIGNEKPQFSLMYDKHMGYVDGMDQSISEYTVSRKYNNKRWIRRFITNIFDFTIQNSYVLYNTKYKKISGLPKVSPSRLHNFFMYNLTVGMLQANSNTTVPVIITENVVNAVPSARSPKAVTCVHAGHSRQNRGQTLNLCSVCKKPACSQHATIVCNSCHPQNNQKLLCLY